MDWQTMKMKPMQSQEVLVELSGKIVYLLRLICWLMLS